MGLHRVVLLDKNKFQTMQTAAKLAARLKNLNAMDRRQAFLV